MLTDGLIKKYLMLVMLNFWLLKNKSQKLEEQSKIINSRKLYYWQKSRYYIEHPKTSRKLSKFLRQAKRVSQVSGAVKKSTSPLYTEKTILETLFDETKTISNAEITRDVMLIKVKQVLIMLKFWILLILNYTQE